MPTVADTLPEPECPVCERCDWHGMGDRTTTIRLGEGPPFLAAVWFVCNHCGYLRFQTPRLYRNIDE
jgi:hypothetical protein